MTPIHLIKLTVGCSSVADLHDWQKRARFTYEGQSANAVHTRYMPKRAEEIIESGGSIYRVINNFIACRQLIIGFRLYDDAAAGTKCQIIVSPELILSESMPRKAFQGWRYFKDEDTPKDSGVFDPSMELAPAEMQQELQKLGLL